MVQNKIKILFVYTEMILGGSTTSLLTLLQNLDPEIYQIDLMLYKNQGPLLECIPPNVNVIQQGCKYSSKKTYLVRIFLLLFSGLIFKAIKENIKYRKKIGLSEQVMTDARVILFSRKCKPYYDFAIGYLEGWPDKYVASDKVFSKKKIGWIHVDYRKSYLIPDLDKRAFKRLDYVVSVSIECERNNRELFELAHSVYLPNLMSEEIVRNRAQDLGCVDEFYKRENINLTKIITVGRLNNIHKGIDRAVFAAQKLKSTGIKFMWIVIGDGVDREEIEKLIIKLDVGDSFKLLGAKVNPLPFVRSSDLFVLPSRYEGKPIVVTESLILGIPTLVTDYASSREQIDDGITGIIVDNNEEALGNALVKLLSDSSNLHQLKNNVAKLKFSNIELIELYVSFFRRCQIEK